MMTVRYGNVIIDLCLSNEYPRRRVLQHDRLLPV